MPVDACRKDACIEVCSTETQREKKTQPYPPTYENTYSLQGSFPSSSLFPFLLHYYLTDFYNMPSSFLIILFLPYPLLPTPDHSYNLPFSPLSSNGNLNLI